MGSDCSIARSYYQEPAPGASHGSAEREEGIRRPRQDGTGEQVHAAYGALLLRLKQMTYTRVAFFAFCAVVGLPCASAQQPTFKAQTNLVQVTIRTTQPPINVLGRDWKPEDFQIFDNGVRQEIAFFQSVQVPLDLAVMGAFRTGVNRPQHNRRVQAPPPKPYPAPGTNVNRLQYNEMVQELRDALGRLHPEDSVAVVRSPPCPKRSVALSQDRNQAVRDFFLPRHRPMPFGEALECASKVLKSDGTIGRAKAILFLSDPYVHPKPDWSAAVQSVLNNDIAVYLYIWPGSGYAGTIGRATGRPPVGRKTEARIEEEPTSVFQELVDSSGGVTATFDSNKAVLSDLMVLMKQAVILAYYPPKDAGWHTIRISLSPEVGPRAAGLRLFHRLKYYQNPAPSDSQGSAERGNTWGSRRAK